MKLQTVKRAAKTKSEINELRREGMIPAVLYVRGQVGETLAVKAADFNAFLRSVKSGHLPTTIFVLVDEKGAERKVVVKEIQYNIINYSVIHLDFEGLVEDQKINIKVPIECIGQVECVGVKQGGVLRQVLRHIRVRCLPKDIPSHFDLDVSALAMRQTKKLKDLDIPEQVCPLVNVNEVVVTIVKR